MHGTLSPGVLTTPLPKTYKTVRDSMDRIMEDYLQRGVAVLEDRALLEGSPYNQWKNALPAVNITFPIRKTLRLTAKELKRPFVWAHRLHYRHWRTGELKRSEWLLTVPRRRYLDVVIAPLLLAAPEPGRYANGEGTPLSWSDFPMNWKFHFAADAAGEALFDSWLEHIKQPECRKALRVDNLPR